MRIERRRGWLTVIVQGLLGRADPAPRCPKCGDDRMVEWDTVLQRYACAVCSNQWRLMPSRSLR